MAEKISTRLQGVGAENGEKDLRILLNAAQTDIAALRASIVGITAKLDADAGVTGTDFASLWNPAALTFTK